jgi:hypothetical protein
MQINAMNWMLQRKKVIMPYKEKNIFHTQTFLLLP